MDFIKLCLLLMSVLQCYGVDVFDQLAHITLRRAENLGGGKSNSMHRRFFDNSVILGAPAKPSHLPQAEPILPGHTLIRPAMGMLKSSVKFPHREQENGSGVYGNIDTIGIRYDGKNERVMFSKFRRMPTRRHYIDMAIPEDNQNEEAFLSIKDIVQIVRSFRRQEENENKDTWELDQSTTEIEDERARSKLFWETQDSFNHVKISPDAPDQSDLLPSDALEDIRGWWFYHQMDFQEFKER